MNWIPDLVVDELIRLGEETPYSHLHHADGSFYMQRYWLTRRKWLDITADVIDVEKGIWGPVYLTLTEEARAHRHFRLHHICTADLGRALHDHPWDFWSLVLRGGYVELRPFNANPTYFVNGEEPCYATHRKAGSLAFRRCTDRHRIIHVEPNTWTLILQGKGKPNKWGFYTPQGKIPWREFESQHSTVIR